MSRVSRASWVNPEMSVARDYSARSPRRRAQSGRPPGWPAGRVRRLHPRRTPRANQSLLEDDGPRRQIVRKHAPMGVGPHEVAQAVEHLAQGVLALARVFGQ